MHTVFDPHAPKKATNLSINSDLLRRARALDINLSATLERALAETLKMRQREQWLAQNASALSAYNALVERDGVFSDGLRSF
ncbi:MAG: type II toxin-antitoxin system CcdA family antitoxin [Gammaproteobacteria bacterium]